MNILVVDDQKSVLEGLKENINFKELGFEMVFLCLEHKWQENWLRKRAFKLYFVI